MLVVPQMMAMEKKKKSEGKRRATEPPAEEQIAHGELEVGVVRLSGGAEGPRSREAKAWGWSYESGTNIVF